MEDTELTRKAIDELMREMNELKEKDSLPTERKKNPLGRPNKRFLGRTINSIMTHNKRQSDRNQQQCQRKLKELDAKERKRKFKNPRRKNSKSESSHEIFSSFSEDGDVGHTLKKHKGLKKKKRRKKKQRSPPSLSSSGSYSSSENDSYNSSNFSVQSKSKTTKKKKHKKTFKKRESEENLYNDFSIEAGMSYFVDPNMAYAAMAYSQMNHMLQQQQIVEQEIVKEELEESIEIPSDLSLSSHSESSLNISLNSSSAEEDEHGILTFKLSSDDEERAFPSNKNVAKRHKNMEGHKYNKDSDIDSVQSIISLDSEAQSISANKSIEICVLSSSDSEYEILEIETIDENINKQLESEFDIKKKEINEQPKTLDEDNNQNTDDTSYAGTENCKINQDLNNMEETKTIISVIDLTDE